MATNGDLVTGESLVYSCDRKDDPVVRLIHFNDVYHVEPGSKDPVGGVSRFKTMFNYYRADDRFKGQSELLTLFSGDAYNPSLESSVTKGSHMVPLLNGLGTDVACVSNHDLDFGIPQFQHLASQCDFPWLLANVLDPGLGEGIPLGNAKPTYMLETPEGVKIGVIGLVEREWLDTINSLPPNLIYKSASATAIELVPGLREQGAQMIIALTHQREPNDNKLAEKTPDGLIDIVLGGHDHFYKHSIINGTHVLRSGSDFKQLSYIKAWPKGDGTTKWDFEVYSRDVLKEVPEDEETSALVEKLTAALKARLDKPIGYTAAPLDGRFSTVRLAESNLGNFVCDLMRLYHSADCTIIGGGTIRGDQIYPPGIIKLKDIMDCFPFEDPVTVLKLKGKAVHEALENGISTYPALEGRFPQVSNIFLEFDPKLKPGSRLTSVKIGNDPLDMDKDYVVATRSYMTKGKDGYDSLLAKSEGGVAEELVDEENGVLLSTILRQYFMSLKVMGRWKRWDDHLHRHWKGVHDDLHELHPVKESAPPSPETSTKPPPKPTNGNVSSTTQSAEKLSSYFEKGDPAGTDMLESDSEDEKGNPRPQPRQKEPDDREKIIIRKVLRKWHRLAGLSGHLNLPHEEEGEFTANWTKGIAPKLEGRIKIVA